MIPGTASLFGVLTLLTVLATSPAVAQQAAAANTVITLQRGGCERRCAVYRLVLFADGTLIYDGQHYVRATGVVRTKVDPSAVASLIEDFQAIGYFALKDQYGYATTEECTAVLSDAPVALTSIVTGDRAKGIVHHHRCVGDVPKQLTDLENKIDRVANSVRWIK